MTIIYTRGPRNEQKDDESHPFSHCQNHKWACCYNCLVMKYKNTKTRISDEFENILFAENRLILKTARSTLKIRFRYCNNRWPLTYQTSSWRNIECVLVTSVLQIFLYAQPQCIFKTYTYACSCLPNRAYSVQVQFFSN